MDGLMLGFYAFWGISKILDSCLFYIGTEISIFPVFILS